MRKLSSEVVLKYLDKWPNTPNLTLAKKIFKENPKLFKSVEHARTIIRLYKGRGGEPNRKEVKMRKHYDISPVNFNPFKLPDSEAEDDTEYIISRQYNKIGVLADMHIPYHDVSAITTALNWFKEKGANAILINGDAVDFYSLSRFNKDPRARDFSAELDDLAQVVRVLNDNFGKVFYKEGNHELRYETYMRIKAPELLNVSEFQIENLLAHRGVQVEYIRHNKIMAGRLPIVHGHEFQSKAVGQVNPARSLMLKAYDHGMVAHSHRTSQHTETTIDNKLLVTFSVGCLCGLHPEYARINKWNWGCAFIELDNEGRFDVDNVRIHKGVIRR